MFLVKIVHVVASPLRCPFYVGHALPIRYCQLGLTAYLFFITEKVFYFNNLLSSKRETCCLFVVKPEFKNVFFSKKY